MVLDKVRDNNVQHIRISDKGFLYFVILRLFLNQNSVFSDIYPRALFIVNTWHLLVHLFLLYKID